MICQRCSSTFTSFSKFRKFCFECRNKTTNNSPQKPSRISARARAEEVLSPKQTVIAPMPVETSPRKVHEAIDLTFENYLRVMRKAAGFDFPRPKAPSLDDLLVSASNPAE
jgi:hypothetical protein